MNWQGLWDMGGSMKNDKRLAVRACAVTDIGQRKNNEDAFLIDENAGVFIVADGMGGHDKGEIASWFTSNNLAKIVAAAIPAGADDTIYPITPEKEPPDSELAIEYAVRALNRRIFEFNEEDAKKELQSAPNASEAEFLALKAAKRRMGTTLVALILRGGRAYVAHVGDSRLYRISAGVIQLLTHDHSWVEERVREGEISIEEAKTHKKRNIITRSIGFKDEVEPDVDSITLYPPERFLLCTDGLSNILKEEEILKFARIENLHTACSEMVALAKDRGGRDNITAILVDILLKEGKGARRHSPSDSEDYTW